MAAWKTPWLALPCTLGPTAIKELSKACRWTAVAREIHEHYKSSVQSVHPRTCSMDIYKAVVAANLTICAVGFLVIKWLLDIMKSSVQCEGYALNKELQWDMLMVRSLVIWTAKESLYENMEVTGQKLSLRLLNGSFWALLIIWL